MAASGLCVPLCLGEHPGPPVLPGRRALSAPTPPPPTGSRPPAPPLRAHLTTLWLLLHLVAVLVYVVPVPPRMDADALALPVVADELDALVATTKRLTGTDRSDAELEAALVDGVRRYRDRMQAVRGRLARWYLGPVGSTQSWNMFGGAVPRRPRVLMVDVRPEGAFLFEPWLDGRPGATGPARLGFRHRKAQNQLVVGGRDRELAAYAAFLAGRWEEQHPGERLQAVRLRTLQTTTRPPREVRAGVPEAPAELVAVFTWAPGETP